MKRWESGDSFVKDQHHHGTPAQRLAAAEAGFKLGYLEAAKPQQAFNAATVHAKAL